MAKLQAKHILGGAALVGLLAAGQNFYEMKSMGKEPTIKDAPSLFFKTPSFKKGGEGIQRGAKPKMPFELEPHNDGIFNA